MVAVTLPEEVVRGLKRLHPDLAWAIVALFRQRPPRAAARQRPPADAELVDVAHGRSLIVVNRDVFKDLPGVHVIPLHGDRAFLALDRHAGVADLELAVVERMEKPSLRARERTALAGLRTQLRRWRLNPALRCDIRSIIVIEHARPR